jgi:hypothetical protein
MITRKTVLNAKDRLLWLASVFCLLVCFDLALQILFIDVVDSYNFHQLSIVFKVLLYLLLWLLFFCKTR